MSAIIKRAVLRPIWWLNRSYDRMPETRRFLVFLYVVVVPVALLSAVAPIAFILIAGLLASARTSWLIWGCRDER